MFLSAQARQGARNATAERREQRAESRAQRVRAATSDLTDALTALLSAYSRVVESAREEPDRGGMSEFVPTVQEIDPEPTTAVQKSWARYQIDTGVQLPIRQDHNTALRRLDLMLEQGTVPVFHDGVYQGETVADLSHAHGLLGDLRTTTDLVLALAQAHAHKLESDLDATPDSGLRRLRVYLGL